MTLKITLFVIALLTNQVLAAGGGGGEPAYIVDVVKIKSVYDGDTFRGYFDKNNQEPIRIKDVDTPEINGKCESEISNAFAARDFLKSTLNSAASIQLVDPSRDRFNRVLAKVLVDGNDLARIIINSGHGRAWTGRRESWCN
ncbi:thermonuclease family protein [Shewanella sp. SG44-6]|jgi:endonuclease YncB( thermonuclease family)|uniref:thermonuclease family protein n=1 Tax=Shewanella sp. SG44-6 TaxID=2760959 RepID=UPI001603915C|nr:thermonuclease family protein [Shewanella sp. SG44-6]MBB1388745.1 thermonuclease family protein [Shewanella sp. SG44-6]